MDYMATLFAHNHLYNGMLQTRTPGSSRATTAAAER